MRRELLAMRTQEERDEEVRMCTTQRIELPIRFSYRCLYHARLVSLNGVIAVNAVRRRLVLFWGTDATPEAFSSLFN